MRCVRVIVLCLALALSACSQQDDPEMIRGLPDGYGLAEGATGTLLIASAGIGIDDDGTEYLCTPYTGTYPGEPGTCRWYLVEGLDTPSALRDFPWSVEQGRGLWSDVAIAGEFTGTLRDGVVTDPRFIGPPQADQTYEIGCNTDESPLPEVDPQSRNERIDYEPYRDLPGEEGIGFGIAQAGHIHLYTTIVDSVAVEAICAVGEPTIIHAGSIYATPTD